MADRDDSRQSGYHRRRAARLFRAVRAVSRWNELRMLNKALSSGTGAGKLWIPGSSPVRQEFMHDPKTSRSGISRRRLISYGTGLLLLGLAIQAGLRGIGQTYVGILERRTVEADADNGIPAVRPGRMKSPRWGLSDDADFLYLRADLLLTQYRNTSDQGETGSGDAVAALEGFRQALRLRPVWARGWARLAYAKAIVGETDAELFQSLVQALRFGPQEHEVREMVAWVGLSEWHHLPQPTRQLVWPVITRAAGDPTLKRSIVRWSVDFGLSAYLMPYLDVAGVRQAESLSRHREAQPRKSGAGRQP